VKAGWQTKRLVEVCRFIDYRGKTPEKTSSGLRLITAKNVKMGYLQRTPMEFVSPDSYERWMTRGIPEFGDVLFTTEAPLANIAQLDTEEKVVFAQRIVVLQPLAGVPLDRAFLKYCLLSDLMQDRIRAQGTGATVQGIKASLLKAIPIEFPALTEQHRIVSILDEAIEAIATAKANAEKNLHNARELYDCQLEALFESGLGQWPERALAQTANIINGYAFKSTDFQRSPGTRSIKITNVGVKEFVADEGNYLPVGFAQRHSSFAVTEGSIVLALTRTIIADGLKVAVVPNSFHGALVNQRVAAIQPHADSLEMPFLFAYLTTHRVMNYVKSRVNTLMQPNLSIADLRQLPVPIPALAEQLALVQALRRFDEDSQKLESICERKLTALNELKKTLLHQAFTGALTAKATDRHVEAVA
jgi:type I restriction enzyme, S subunit